MTTRPIIFSTPMIQALLADRKTQTRRLGTSPLRNVEVGDLLWVREHWRTESDYYNDLAPSDMSGEEPIIYTADADWSDNHTVGRHRQGMHMPRWASRLTLKVTRVRHDRLQRITREDCRSEGHPRRAHQHPDPDVDLDAARDWFMDLWDDLHDKPGERWRDNPMVVALNFEVIRGNVDQVVKRND